ncbi:arylamine N-acetyltransferase family protein [Ilumatobacter sp.]|uniref:arylamine N-acetyltransferase family protein n=1 Tax=Ilumatobacter sp. TaxID=1967498 RepID=UPI003C4C974F
MHDSDIERYLDRLGLQRRSIRPDLDGLAILQRAHLTNVAFENLDIVFADGVPHDREQAFDKIVRDRRGGWCFELNGVFALLLEALGFEVKLLGAAVLLGGPSTVLEHLALEVSTGESDLGPHFVDVGFGDGLVRPIKLNRSGPQDGGNGMYELLGSPQGTTLARLVDDIPEAQMRFKRVAHRFDDFAPIAASMQVDPNKHWSSKPFATRLLDTPEALRNGSDPLRNGRVTLTTDRLEIVADGESTTRPVRRDEWDGVLDDWFEMERPGPWPD